MMGKLVEEVKAKANPVEMWVEEDGPGGLRAFGVCVSPCPVQAWPEASGGLIQECEVESG